ncbi:F0F1 ATP synthase subunit A [uncultured Bacteroides sp.]|uniref:F0F1 ATP synthase subunit A n=1 Tax=uncultured Bacteroides sp. TaxID=162156 RepID=UPI002620EAF1|nr:F0F1 ATP synthase subunit A [uncultured Bacteroides sp.]
MKKKHSIGILLLLVAFLFNIGSLKAEDYLGVEVDSLKASVDSLLKDEQLTSAEQEENTVDVKDIVMGHIGDSYEWHITTWGNLHLTVPLPVIIYSEATGWHVFSSSRLAENNGSYEGLSIAPKGSRYEGKLVEYDSQGNEVRPWDFSITKVACALLINSMLLIIIVLSVARWYRKHPQGSSAPGGFIGFMEMFIMMVNDDVIKSCIGPKYRRFSPYLLTAFFFIFINNLMGLIPFFPGGANVTGNIAVTMVLAFCTFLAVNLFGTKTYWKDIFWPDVPWWLKVPIPMMPLIEFFGVFTKPFALMIRLFANMLAGHMAMLVLTCLIFISVSMGAALNSTLTFASVLFNIFMNALELLVAFIQAYVFTMLSAVFIGLAQEDHPHEEKEKRQEVAVK